MLTFAEELVLLALDDEDGEIRALPQMSMGAAIAAGVLEELSFLRKLDATPDSIYVADHTPLHLDDLTTKVFNLVAVEKEMKPIAYWLNKIVEEIPDLTERVLASLIAKKILKRENQRVFWVFEKCRYPVIDDREIGDVKNRLRKIITSGEIPDPRDMVLISLTRACRLFLTIFTPEEREKYAPQIDKIAKFAFVGQALSKSLREIERIIGMMNEAIYKYN